MEDPGNLKNSAQNGLQQNYNDNASRDSVDYKQVRWNMVTKQQNRKLKTGGSVIIYAYLTEVQKIYNT